MKNAWTRVRFAMVLAAGAGLSTTTCGTALVEDLCDARCDCSGCSEDEREECSIERQGRVDHAGAYDCEEEYIEYLQCFVDESRCEDAGDGDEFLTDCDDSGQCACDDELQDYSECEDSASDEELIDVD